VSEDHGGRLPIQRALVSVFDKRGIEDLAVALSRHGVAIVSTGSTAARIAAAGVDVTLVEEITGFPEILDGRVKTLHPHVHAGLLADRRLEAHRAQLDQLGIDAFDLVVSNLYPFSEAVRSGADFDACIEQIDIGGPSMARAAAKNHPSVAIVTSPTQYSDLIAALDAGGYTLSERRRLAAEAFAHTAAYDVEVGVWFANQIAQADVDASAEPGAESAPESGAAPWPAFAASTFRLATPLRYGENSHQGAALYVDPASEPGLAQAEQLGGKEMSYNNYVDAQSAHRTAYDFEQPAVAIVKHANPCGVAVGGDVAQAHAKANACDPVSAFGGVIATNRRVSAAMAKQVAEVFTEVLVAPEYDDEALDVLGERKNLRILRCGPPPSTPAEWRQVSGGLLVQHVDRFQGEGDDPNRWTLAAGEPLDAAGLADAAFAWRACRSVKSNAILLAHDGASVGVGMGQVNRVDSARLAVQRAGDRAAGSVAASDAFFPFADGVEVLVDAGVRAIVQPGGSLRDDEAVAAAEAGGVSMYLTGTRHFFH
jgi:phosphoribosylaminoimidazolecarboxamide formyltransferase/IMP cyclohydrolase